MAGPPPPGGADAPRWAIGLDVGGTKIAGGLVVGDTGEVRARLTIPTGPERGGEAVLADAVALAEQLAAEADAIGLGLRGVGVAVAELVDGDEAVRTGHLIGWAGLPVRSRFAHLAQTTLESDVRAAALAEARLGAGLPFDPFVYVTVGTGISSCLVQGGRPYAGARGGALVLASGPLSLTCDACGAPVRQVVEEVASGPALVDRYRRRGSRSVARAEDVVAAVAAGDADAADVVGTAGDALGGAVGFLVNVLDPAAIVVGGGLGVAGGLYWDRFVAATRAHVWNAAARDLPIIPAGLGPDSALVGAALAAMDVAAETSPFAAERQAAVLIGAGGGG